MQPKGPATTKRARGRPRSEQAHQAILDAGLALTREVGYDAVSIEGIAARAGVGKTTVYRRWPSKELLIVDAITGIMRTIVLPDTGAVEDDVLALMRGTMTMYADPATGPLLSGLVAAMARSEPVATAVRAGFVKTWRDVMKTVLRRAVERGELRDDLDPELALDLLAGPLFYRYLLIGRAIDLRFTRAVVATVLRALAPCHPERAQRVEGPAPARTKRPRRT